MGAVSKEKGEKRQKAKSEGGDDLRPFSYQEHDLVFFVCLVMSTYRLRNVL